MICHQCAIEFNPSPRQIKFCSSKCQQKYGRLRHYNKNPEAYFQKRLRENSDWSKRSIYRIKSRAKKYGIPFDLEASDILLPDVCPVLGIPLVFTHLSGKPTGYRPNAPSVDRVVPSLGYTKGNVKVISAKANLLKNDGTIEEHEKVLLYMKGLLNETSDC